MDREIYEILDSYKTAIDFLVSENQKLNEKVAAVEQDNERLNSAFYDEIINPAKQAMDDYDKNERFNDFNSKYGERLSSYNDKLKPFEGEDFDLSKTAFDNYDALEEKPESDAYVDELVKQVDEQLSSIKQALGVPEDTAIEVKQDEEGNTTVEADGETVASEEGSANAPEAEGETESEPESEAESKAEGSANEEEPVETEEPKEEEDNSPEEVAAYEEELRSLLK